MAFKRITPNKLMATRELIKFLHRLRVIGEVQTRIERITTNNFGQPTLFSLHYLDYDPSTKRVESFEDELDKYFKSHYAQDIYNE